MDFDFSPEQERVQRAARDFAAREVEPIAAELDRSARWPAEVVARLGALGWLGAVVPEGEGGAGLDHVGLALVIEEISAACAGTGAILGAHNALFCGPLLAFGTPEQRRDILAPAAAGKALGAAAVADDAGHDGGRPPIPPGPAGATAERQPDGSFLLRGSKGFVTAGPTTEHFLILARTSEEPRSTALLVRRGAPGFIVGPPVETMGVRAAHVCSLSFEGVRVPAERVLGAEGGGAEVAASALPAARIAVAARAVGTARAALDKATAHLARVSPRSTPQAIQFMISDTALEIDAARLLVLRAARRRDEGTGLVARRGPDPAGAAVESAAAKLFASEAATRAAHRAMAIFGSEGQTVACGVERHYRDARSTELDDGTSEAQRRVIAAAVLAG